MIGATPTGAGAGSLNEVFFWCAVLLAVAVAGGLVILIVRKVARSGNGGEAAGFTLHELRAMRESGRITPDEFERAKAQLIARLHGPSDKGVRDDGPPETPQAE